MKNTLSLVDDAGVSVSSGMLDGEMTPLVEPGIYELAFLYHRTAMIYGRAPKLACTFRIVSHGPYHGVVLNRWYHVKKLLSKPRRGGRFTYGRHSDFLREYVNLFGMPPRFDRISPEIYKTQIIRGRVRTVATNNRGHHIPEGLQYSVIDELLGVCK